MASVKWLRSITALDRPFEGVQQRLLYRLRDDADDPGEPVMRKRPRALMVPPGIPDFLTRRRQVAAGAVAVEGRAWSGYGPVTRVEFSDDGGHTWGDAELGQPLGRYGWTSWRHEWRAEPGQHELCVRATDAAGNTQPPDAATTWNYGGYAVNAVQRVPVTVTLS